MLAQDDSDFDIVSDLTDGVSDFVGQVIGFLPKLIAFLAILFIGWWVAKIIARVIRKAFKAINLDHYLDKAGIGGPLERAGYADSGKFVGKIIYYLIMLIVLKLAFGALEIDALNEPFDQLIAWIPKALVALILIVVGGIVANVVADMVRAATATQSFSNLAVTVAKAAVWFFFGMAALDQAGIAGDLVDTLTTTVLASLGAILIIKYGVGGIWAARDRFWPGVYDTVGGQAGRAPAPAPRPPQQ